MLVRVHADLLRRRPSDRPADGRANPALAAGGSRQAGHRHRPVVPRVLRALRRRGKGARTGETRRCMAKQEQIYSMSCGMILRIDIY